jgi:hypothetical protein
MGDEERKTLDLEFERADINIPLLHQELKAVLGAHFTGVSTGNGHVRVHVFDDTPPEVCNLAKPVVIAHNAAALTADQRKEADREALIASLRKPWASWAAVEKDRFLQLLAERLGIGE